MLPLARGSVCVLPIDGTPGWTTGAFAIEVPPVASAALA
jgi:hypothetical protein